LGSLSDDLIVERTSVHVVNTMIHLLSLVKGVLSVMVGEVLLVFLKFILERLEMHMLLLHIFAAKCALLTA